MKLYFARHGHTDANQETVLDQTVQQINEPLNQVGIQQANDLADKLKDVSFDVIISSPLHRALQTAEIVNKNRHLPIEIDGVWRERDTGGYVTLEVWNDLFDFEKNLSLENSEDLEAFFNRVYAALETLKKRHKAKTVLVVSHGGVHQALYAYVNNLPHKGNVRNSPLHNCEYRIYDI